MTNRFLDPDTARDIDQQVAKIRRGLGDPGPPLDMDQVRELLKLDRHYYSSANDSPLRELVSHVWVAGRQILLRPSLILQAVRKLDLKALYVPDRHRILIDCEQPQIKWRWNEAHETTHSIVEWHQTLLHGDTRFTLSQECHERIEAEANYGAGRLLFLQELFEGFVRDSPVSFSTVRAASKLFGNTMTSTLWRMVEALDIPAFATVSQHPCRPDEGFDATHPCRYLVRSRPFEHQFAGFTGTQAFSILGSYCSRARRGPLGESEQPLTDDRGTPHVFRFETFFNGYEALTLASRTGASAPLISVPRASSRRP